MEGGGRRKKTTSFPADEEVEGDSPVGHFREKTLNT